MTRLGTAAQETITEGIKETLQKYLAEIAFEQPYVSYARISDKILDVPGVIDHEGLTVAGGTANIPIGDREVATLGEVTVQYAGSL